MKNIIRYLLLVFSFAALLALAYFVWTYRQHYGVEQNKSDISKILEKYNITPMEAGSVQRVEEPKLPDIAGYTVETVKAMLPEAKPGRVSVENLEDGYVRMRSHLAFFGDLQGRLDPLSIVVSEGVYDLETLVKEIDDDSLIKKRQNGIYVLYVPLSIESEASLVLKDGDVLFLSDTTGALISNFGNLYMIGAEVKGWSTKEDGPATLVADDEFRPHMTTWCGSKLYIAKSKISHLGYHASKSYGVSYTSCSDTLYRDDYAELPGGTGWIIESIFEDNYFGFYSYEADDVVILGNIYDGNIVYGIDPHDRSKNLIIAYNTVKNTQQKHGIITSRDVSDSFIFKNTVEDNTGSGIMLDRNSADNIIAYNISQRNKGDGLAFYESGDNISYGNLLNSNGRNGMSVRNSLNINSQNDTINFNQGAGAHIYTLDLTSNQDGKKRDITYDPYEQKAGSVITDVEMVGNEKSQFKLSDIESFKINNPRFYQSPPHIFTGDFKGIDAFYMQDVLNPQTGLEIKKKDQNLTRSSVDPR